jgi:hypothetical protein
MSESPGAVNPWVRVRNAAFQYLGVSYFLTQVLIVTARQFGAPAWLGDYLIIALGLGFILTLILTFVMARRGVAPPRKRHLVMAGTAAVAGLGLWLISGGQPELRSGQYGIVRESRGLFSTSSDVHAFLVVHPQEPFRPTGIRVEAGQKVSAWADGRINVGLATLVAGAEDGNVEPYEWVGPEGEVDATGQPVIRRDRGLPGRERCLLQAAFPYGSLLLLVSATDRPIPGSVRDLRPGREAFVVGSELEVDVGVAGYLVLAVNDVYLDREDCDPAAFRAGSHANKHYLDNLGFFSVRLQLR